MRVCCHVYFRCLAAESRLVKAIICSVRDGRGRTRIPEVHISWSGYTVYSIQREFIMVQWEIHHCDLCTCVCVCQSNMVLCVSSAVNKIARHKPPLSWELLFSLETLQTKSNLKETRLLKHLFYCFITFCLDQVLLGYIFCSFQWHLGKFC